MGPNGLSCNTSLRHKPSGEKIGLLALYFMRLTAVYYLLALSNSSLKSENILPIRPSCMPKPLAALLAVACADDLLAGGIGPIRDTVAALAPGLDLAELDATDDLKLLTVTLDRLTRWHRPGLLAIGDAAPELGITFPAGEDAHFVYKRQGLPCRVCRTVVLIADLAGRNLYWCPNCQAE